MAKYFQKNKKNEKNKQMKIAYPPSASDWPWLTAYVMDLSVRRIIIERSLYGIDP